MLAQAVTAMAIQESENKHQHLPFADDAAMFRLWHDTLRGHADDNSGQNEGIKALCDIH